MSRILLCILLCLGVLPVQAARHALLIGNSVYDPNLAIEKDPNLPNPRNDAAALAQALGEQGFQVRVHYDLRLQAMKEAVAQFTAAIRPGDTALFYFAGHAIETDGRNWLIPVRTALTLQSEVYDRALSAQTVVAEMERATLGPDRTAKGLNLLLLDACRNNPFRGFKLRGGGGLGEMHPTASGTLISFAAAAGRRAEDGRGDNSPYVASLLAALNTFSGQTVEQLFKQVVAGVEQRTGGRQQPWLQFSLKGDFCLHAKGCAKHAWRRLDRRDPAALRAFVADYPHSDYAGAAQALLESLSNVPVIPPAPDVSARLADCAFYLGKNWLLTGPGGGTDNTAVACYRQVLQQDRGNRNALEGLSKVEQRYAELADRALAAGNRHSARTYRDRLHGLNPDSALLAALDTRLDTSGYVPLPPKTDPVPSSGGRTWREPVTGMEFVRIPGGCFQMGSPTSEKNRGSDERRHRVCVEDFWMGKTEVTQAQWRKITGDNPARFKGDNKPVERVSWNDIQGFMQQFKTRSGKAFRLPTEAEWEYAARAGTDTSFYTGRCISTDQANYNGNYPYAGCPKGKYREQTVETGSFAPNDFGLYDMHGNVWEWTCSVYDKNYGGDESACKNNAKSYVLRGGSWGSYGRGLRSADRDRYFPAFRSYYSGFRVMFR